MLVYGYLDQFRVPKIREALRYLLGCSMKKFPKSGTDEWYDVYSESCPRDYFASNWSRG